MRLGRQDWLELGRHLLREKGPGALSLDALTAAAGRTRGSFYHPFEDCEAYLRELVARWRRDTLEDRAAALAPCRGPEELRAFLRDEPFRLDHAFGRALRLLAAAEPALRPAVDEVDRARVEALAMLISALRPDFADPKGHALLQYAALVGSQWLIEDPADPRLASLKQAAYGLFKLEED